MFLISCLLGLALARTLDVYIYTSERTSKGLSIKGGDFVITKDPIMHHIELINNIYYIKAANNNYLTLTKDHLHLSPDKSPWILRRNTNVSDATGINHYQLENNSKCLTRDDDVLSAEKCDITKEKQLFFFVSPANNVDPTEVAKFLDGTIDAKIRSVDKTFRENPDRDEEADMYKIMIKRSVVTVTKTIVQQDVPNYVEKDDPSSSRGGSGTSRGAATSSKVFKSAGFGSFSGGKEGGASGYESFGDDSESRPGDDAASGRRRSVKHDSWGRGTSTSTSTSTTRGDENDTERRGTSTTRGDEHDPERRGTSTRRSDEHDPERRGTSTRRSDEHDPERRGNGIDSSDSGDWNKQRGGARDYSDSDVAMDSDDTKVSRKSGRSRDESEYSEDSDEGGFSEHGRRDRTRHRSSSGDRNQEDSIDSTRRDPTRIFSDDASSSRNRGLIPSLIADLNENIVRPEKDEVDRAFKNLKKEASDDKTALRPKVTLKAKTAEGIPGDKLKGFRMTGPDNKPLEIKSSTTMVPVRMNRRESPRSAMGANQNNPSNPFFPQNGTPQRFPQPRMNPNQQAMNNEPRF